jgi:hypothetical protein
LFFVTTNIDLVGMVVVVVVVAGVDDSIVILCIVLVVSDSNEFTTNVSLWSLTVQQVDAINDEEHESDDDEEDGIGGGGGRGRFTAATFAGFSATIFASKAQCLTVYRSLSCWLLGVRTRTNTLFPFCSKNPSSLKRFNTQSRLLFKV